MPALSLLTTRPVNARRSRRLDRYGYSKRWWAGFCETFVLARDVVRFAAKKWRPWPPIDIAKRAAQRCVRRATACSIGRGHAPTPQPCTGFMTYERSRDQNINVTAHAVWQNATSKRDLPKRISLEHTFRTQRQHQGYIEPTPAWCISTTKASIKSGSAQMPFQVRQQLADGIDQPRSVRVNPAFIGGDLAAKAMDTHGTGCAHNRAPIRMVMTWKSWLGNPRPWMMTLNRGQTGRHHYGSPRLSRL